MNRQDPNCRRQRFAWTLDGTTPPTLLAADQPLGLGLRETVWLNDQGLRVDVGCPGAKAHDVALWPAPLEPWLPRAERRAARLPAVDPICPPQLVASAPPLSIVGVRAGDNLRRPATSHEPLQLRVSALGGAGRRWWFLNGQPLGETQVRWMKVARRRGWRFRSASESCSNPLELRGACFAGKPAPTGTALAPRHR
jgi:penicillin-binding protein 1C